jgi:hypothetical protein
MHSTHHSEDMTTNKTHDAHYFISRQGAAWSTVIPSTLAAQVERVEGIFAREVESEARIGKRNTWDGWLECDYQGFDDSGKSGVVTRPIVVCVETWDYNATTREGRCKVVARWVRGERVL